MLNVGHIHRAVDGVQTLDGVTAGVVAAGVVAAVVAVARAVSRAGTAHVASSLDATAPPAQEQGGAAEIGVGG